MGIMRARGERADAARGRGVVLREVAAHRRDCGLLLPREAP